MLHSTAQSSFLLGSVSLFWILCWVFSIVTYRLWDLSTQYALIQILFCFLYFTSALFLDTGFKLWKWEITSQVFTYGLLTFDFVRRIVFVGVGSTWIHSQFGLSAMEILNSRMFYRIPFLNRLVCIHILFSMILVFMDGVGVVYLIFHPQSEDLAPVPTSEPEEKAEIEMTSIFTEKRVSLDVCAICNDDMTDAVQSIQCGHVFHKACIEEWIKMHPTCPLCRSDFTVVHVQ
jgi:hypothetical protein